MKHILFLLLVIAVSGDQLFAAEDTFRFPDGSTNYKSPNNALTMPIPMLSGAERAVSVGFNAADPTNDVAVIDRNNWMLAVVYTRIRPEYPKDFRVIEERVKPLKVKIAEKYYGRNYYELNEHSWAGTKILEELTFSPALDLPRDIESLRDVGPGFSGSNKNNQKRVDIWYVSNGYLIQIIAVTNGLSKIPAKNLMEKAQLLAKSAFENIKIAKN